MKQYIDSSINPNTGNHYWFDYMLNSRWTIKAIRCTFGVPSAIAEHIQMLFPTEKQAFEVVKAHQELCIDQVGF